MSRDIKVLGRTIQLGGERLVFVGTSEQTPDTFYIAFRNDEGDDTKFTLSREAKEAFADLLTKPIRGEQLSDFPHKKVWALVKGDQS